jgi:hypothetical protein
LPYKSITTSNSHNVIHQRREQFLEKRIELLQERIHQLEKETSSSRIYINEKKTNKTNPSGLVLPVIYTPEEEHSPKFELVSYPPMDGNHMPLLLIEQLNTRVYETIV